MAKYEKKGGKGMRRKAFLSLVLFFSLSVSFLAFGFASAAPPKPIELTFNHFTPPVGIMAENYKAWASMIEQRTGGRVKIKFYWSSALFGMKEVLRSISSGIADIGFMHGAYEPSAAPLGLILDTTYNADDLWVGQRAHSRLYETVPELKNEYLKNGVQWIAPYTSGTFQWFMRDKWTSSDDFKGKVGRIMGGARTLWYKKLGLKGVFLPVNEIYEATERGMIWGFENTLNLANDLKHQEVIKTVVLLNSGVVMGTYTIMNKKKFDSLPKDIQGIILATGKDWGENLVCRTIYEKEQKIIGEWKKMGITAVTPAPDDLKKMKKMAKEANLQFAKQQDAKRKTPGQSVKILEALWKEVEKAEAELAQKGLPWKK
jgi:TRAP-type C4-dicarboxylate transport system substrate-binding protein